MSCPGDFWSGYRAGDEPASGRAGLEWKPDPTRPDNNPGVIGGKVTVG